MQAGLAAVRKFSNRLVDESSETNIDDLVGTVVKGIRGQIRPSTMHVQRLPPQIPSSIRTLNKNSVRDNRNT